MVQQKKRKQKLSVVKAGGKSSRIKQSTAILSGSHSFNEVDRVKPIAQELNRESGIRIRFLDVKIVDDLIHGKGALGGLYTAMDIASNEYVAVVACDYFVSSRSFEGLELPSKAVMQQYQRP